MKKQMSTSLEQDLIKELKVFCAETDSSLNEIIENALSLYLAIYKNKKWTDIANKLPEGSKLQDFCYLTSHEERAGV